MATRSLRLNYGDGTGPGKVGEILFRPLSATNNTAFWTTVSPARVALKYNDPLHASTDPGYSPEYTVLGAGKYVDVPVTVGASYGVKILRINGTRLNDPEFQITIPAGASVLDISTLTPTPIVLPSASQIIDSAVAAAVTSGTSTSAALTPQLVKFGRRLPSYVPTTVAGTYDSKVEAYNWKSSNTRRLRVGLGKAASGGLCEIVAIGDSSVAGCTNGATLTYDRLRAWPISARDELGRHGMAVAGSGLVRALEGPTIVDSRWTYPAGTWDSSQYTFPYLLSTGNALFTSDRSGDRVFVKYYDPADGGSFTISVNGASSGAGFQTVSYSTAGQKSVTLSAPITAGQTVRLTRVGGSLWPVGVNVFNSTGGVMVHNIAQSGSKAHGSGNISWVNIADSPNIMNVFASVTTDGSAPAAVFCGLGGNDLTAGNTTAQITSALTTIRGRYPNSDFILVAPNQLADTYVTAANWEAYIATLYALADTLDVPLIDMRARVGNYATTLANGITVDGQGHLTAPAYADLGRQVGMLLAS